MKCISNRKEIINQISFLATGKINFIPVNSKKATIGEIFCNRVKYGEFEVGFTQKNIAEEKKTAFDWKIIMNLIDRICYLINKSHYNLFRISRNLRILVFKETVLKVTNSISLIPSNSRELVGSINQ
jgi:hypothetical protein